ncbi:hypothetical protein LWI28_012959 [Acer negundo]|uniref:Uncharacterized protein n=1 Tax=Acer negundo TaxID=4023 RepID=A0AAD5NLN9_ACENE|nr:hypothetical protein LWI28_012959 [Acer negundo]
MGQCTSSSSIKRRSKDKEEEEEEEMKEEGNDESKTNGCLCLVSTVKEKKSRFYIARRCAVMLLCWHKYGK